MPTALAIVVLLTFHNLMLAQSSSASKAGKRLPSGEVWRLMDAFGGSWSTAIKFERSKKMPAGLAATGTEVWRPGPGGLSAIEDSYSTDSVKEIFGLGIGWWDRKVQRYQFSRCESTDSKGCRVLKQGAHWETGRLVLMDERQERGKTMVTKEVFSAITRSSFKQTIYEAESGYAFRTVATILATKISAGIVPAEHRLSLQMPGPQVQNSMLGTFSIQETDALGKEMPDTGNGPQIEVWYRGPGGYSVIEESFHANGNEGSGAFAPAWWDTQANGQRFVFCSDQIPDGCVVSKSVAKWEGDRNVYTEQRIEGGKTIVSREIFENITSTSFLQLIQKDTGDGRLATVRTMRAMKTKAQFPIHSWK